MAKSKHGMGKEYPHTDSILLLSAVLFSAVWILDSFVFKFSERYTSCFPDVVRIVVFAALEISAVPFGYLSHNALFSRKQEESKLIMDGVFAHVRHPMYLSVLLAYLGFVFASVSIVSVIPWICFIMLFDKMATYEEEDLVRIFDRSIPACAMADATVAYNARTLGLRPLPKNHPLCRIP